MISIDTNVLLRYLVGDEPKQAEKARDLIGSAEEQGTSVFLGQVVLCEAAWVLETAYNAPKREIVSTLRRLLGSELFVLEQHDRVRDAVARFASGRGDFADYLVGHAASDSGARTTYTFDKSFRDEPDYSLLH